MNLAAALGPQSETRVVTCSPAIMMAVEGLGPSYQRPQSGAQRPPAAPRQAGQTATNSVTTDSQSGSRAEKQRERERQRDVYLLKKCELLHCKFTSARSVNNKR